MNDIPRKYPIGIQTFERMIQEGYIYIDKTDMVWDIAHLAPFVFLSRPRRFGKFLLSITGITQFSQLSIFSTLNNLKNISMLPAFAAICGITEKELTTTLAEDILKLATEWGCSFDEAHEQLKQQYDGYHFAHSGDEVYNPFSLFNAFGDMELNNYWFSTGTPTFPIRQLQHFHTDITCLNDYEVPADAFDLPTEALTNELPLLYQSGYVTIKGYDRMTKLYKLAIPNNEVLTGLTKGLIPIYIGIEAPYVQTGFAVKFWRALLNKDVDWALNEMRAFMAGIPYVEGFKKKLAEAATAEGFYEYTLYLIFSMLNVYVRTQVKCHGGRVDMVVMMPDTTYVFEIKTSMSVQKAMRQIDDHGYALPYYTEGRQVVKVAVKFDCQTMNVQEWSIASLS